MRNANVWCSGLRMKAAGDCCTNLYYYYFQNAVSIMTGLRSDSYFHELFLCGKPPGYFAHRVKTTVALALAASGLRRLGRFG